MSGDDATLYRAHHAKLKASALRLLHDPAAAEDVASEALARGWSRRDTFTDDDGFAAWTWRVARNLCIDQLRGRHRVISLDTVGDRPDDTADVSTPIEREEERRFVRAAFARLTDRHRTVLYLREVEGVEYPELARRMGMSQDNARQVVNRARRGLRDALKMVADGALGIVLWLRLRTRDSADRLTAAGQPALARIAEAAAVLALAGGLAAIPGTATIEPDEAPSTRVRAEHLRAERPFARPVADAPVASAGSNIGGGRGSRPGVWVGVDREDGSAGVRASVPMGDAGQEDVFVNVWREHEEAPSVILSVTDEVVNGTCIALAPACDVLEPGVGTP